LRPVRRAGRALRTCLLSALLAVPAACGFQPVVPPSVPYERMYVTAPDFSSFGAQLKRYVEGSARTHFADDPKAAQAVLEIMSEHQEKQILSLDTAGKVAEYLLRYQVTFRLRAKDNSELIAPTTISLQRDVTYDVDAVLGSENQDTFLYNAMRNEAIQQMLVRVSAVQIPA
jgi:LPS-assembly lipoprotein